MAGNNSSVRWCGTCDTTNFPCVNSNNVGTSKRYEVDFSQDGASDGLSLNHFVADEVYESTPPYARINQASKVDAYEAKTVANAALAQLGHSDLLGLGGLGGNYDKVQKITIRCEMAPPQSGPHHSRVRFTGTADTTDFPAVNSSGLANTSVKYELMLNQTGAAATDLSSYYVAGFTDYPYTAMLTADDAKLVANAVAAQVISYIGTSNSSSLRKVMIRCDMASP